MRRAASRLRGVVLHSIHREFTSSGVRNARDKVGPSGEISKFARKKFEKLRQQPVERPYVAPQPAAPLSPVKVVEIFEGMTMRELASRLQQSESAVQSILNDLGESCESGDEALAFDASELVALEFGAQVKRVDAEVRKDDPQKEVIPLRPPVITVMGHVDHGKTSLLDALRKSSVAAGEAGGITQHLGAFVVKMSSGASLTFLDTPGHAAFSAMRARGAAVTDIVVLVVAADDGVKPQTLEALSHAQEAKVPIVVAINKCDKEDADPARVRQQLIMHSVELEEIGGDVQVVEVSAKQSTGLNKLEEALLLMSEMMDLRARTDGDAHGVVIEARLDRGQGPLATVIVRSGTLKQGAIVVVGHQWGRVRCLRDMTGAIVKSAGPATPVEVSGLRGAPLAGDSLNVLQSEDRAKKLAEKRQLIMEQDRLQKRSLKAAAATPATPAAEDEGTDQAPKAVNMPLVVKADVQGTLEAVLEALESLNNEQVSVSIVHSGIGPVSEADFLLAEACQGCLIAFTVKCLPSVEAMARRAKIPLVHHRVIYHLLEEVGKLIIERAPGTSETRIAGQAEVLAIFEIKGKGRAGVGAAKIAGCRVFEGRLLKGQRVKVLRSGTELFDGKLSSLKREKLDVDTVGKGTECGLIVNEWMEFSVGDVVQCIEEYKRLPTFVSSDGKARIEC
ncbi:uncharacterized protein LOC9637320 [Selaginella moellendorffii]|nr:uncharacterized protein LOC9637320 [Selaginella moellendorffii]|eukprot:XP_002972752.2 uncharacterized protein LOC9637320 [Selaginella moellendorffii]